MRRAPETELELALARLSEFSAKVIDQTIYALTTGAVAPDYELPATDRDRRAGKHEMKGRRQ